MLLRERYEAALPVTAEPVREFAIPVADSLPDSLAFMFIVDRELSARICVMLCQWGRAVKHYPETMTADMIRTQCDTYKDHRI